MTKKWIAINLMLLVAAGLLGWRLYVSVKRYREENNVARLARLQTPKKKTGADAGLTPVRGDQKLSDADFAVIPAQNLFADTRRLEDKVDNTPQPEPARKLDIIPVLVGVTMIGSQRMALINDPAAGNAPGGSRYQTMRLGDHYRGFVVTDISNSGMVLEWGASREVIPLYDTSKSPTQSGKTPILATRVVNFGGGTTGGGVVSSVAAGARPVPAVNTAPASGAGGARTPSGAVQRPEAAGRGVNVPQPVVSGGGAVSPGPTWNTTIDRQGNVIVNSPFGAFTLPPGQTTTQPVKK
jgi:hypothetical protein